MQKCKLQPTRRRSTNEFGQLENSCGRVRRLFGRGRVITKSKRVLNKKKVKLVRSDCKFAIASGRVRTSCNFHTVRRPSLRTSSDELQSRPDFLSFSIQMYNYPIIFFQFSLPTSTQKIFRTSSNESQIL